MWSGNEVRNVLQVGCISLIPRQLGNQVTSVVKYDNYETKGSNIYALNGKLVTLLTIYGRAGPLRGWTS